MGSDDAKEPRISVGLETPSNHINISKTWRSIVSNSDSKHEKEF